MRHYLLLLAGVATLGLAAPGAIPVKAQEAAQGERDWYEHPYIVENGAVDFGTYNGYRRYHASCHTCHGPDGLGSSYAPNLVQSLKSMDYDQFLDVVVNGRQNVGQAQQNVMPAFAEDQNVMLHIDDIYAYLKGRADDAVARGRPERLDPENDPVFKERKG